MLWITMTTNVSFFNYDRMFYMAYELLRGKIFSQERKTSKGGNIFNNKQDEPLIEVFKPLVQRAK